MEFFSKCKHERKNIFCKTLARHFRCHLMPFKSTNKQLENYSDKKQKSQKPSKYAVSSSFLLAGDERIELPPKVLETPIIPFDQSPIYRKNLTPIAALNFLGTFFLLYLQNFTQKVSNLTPLFNQ